MLKAAFLAWPAAAAHSCAADEVVPVGDREVVAAGVAWPGKVLTSAAVYIAPTTKKADRYGRVHGFLFETPGGEPVQLRWLRDGRAFAAPGDAPAACREMLLTAEAEARQFDRGLWRERRIERAPDRSLAKRADRFAVVEGRVVSVGDRGRRLYLNFGTFWKQDFTVLSEKGDFKRHPEIWSRMVASEGRLVRVRGRLTVRDGPFMKVRDVGQIEFIDD